MLLRTPPRVSVIQYDIARSTMTCYRPHGRQRQIPAGRRQLTLARLLCDLLDSKKATVEPLPCGWRIWFWTPRHTS